MRTAIMALLMTCLGGVAHAEEAVCTTSRFANPGLPGTCAPEFQCKENKSVVGKCFKVHGMVVLDASFRLSLEEGEVFGNNRYWLTIDRRFDYMPLPARVVNLLDPHTAVVGDYLVCPFDNEKTAQLVCVEHAENLKPQYSVCEHCAPDHTPLPDSAFKGLPP